MCLHKRKVLHSVPSLVSVGGRGLPGSELVSTAPTTAQAPLAGQGMPKGSLEEDVETMAADDPVMYSFQPKGRIVMPTSSLKAKAPVTTKAGPSSLGGFGVRATPLSFPSPFQGVSFPDLASFRPPTNSTGTTVVSRLGGSSSLHDASSASVFSGQSGHSSSIGSPYLRVSAVPFPSSSMLSSCEDVSEIASPPLVALPPPGTQQPQQPAAGAPPSLTTSARSVLSTAEVTFQLPGEPLRSLHDAPQQHIAVLTLSARLGGSRPASGATGVSVGDSAASTNSHV